MAILDPREALVPFVLYFWWPLLVYFAVQSASPVALFMLAAAAIFTIMLDGGAGANAIARRSLSLLASPVSLALLALLLYFALTAPFAHPAAPVIERAVKAALTVALGIAIFATVPRFLRDTPPWVVVSGTMGAAAIAIVDAYIRFRIRGIFPVERIGNNVNAGFVNFPIVTLALLAFPVAAALAETRQRVLIALMFVLVIYAAYATNVLTAVVAAVAGLAVVAIAASLGVRRAAFVLAAATAVYAFAAPYLLPHLGDLLGPRIMARLSEGYASERIQIWTIVAAEIRNHWWIGQGLDSLQQLGHHYGAQGRPLGHAHSLFLQVWAEDGFIGVALLVAMAAASIQALARLPGPVAMWGLGWAGALIAAVSFDFGSLQSWMHVTIILTAVALVGLTGVIRAPRGSRALPTALPASEIAPQ